MRNFKRLLNQVFSRNSYRILFFAVSFILFNLSDTAVHHKNRFKSSAMWLILSLVLFAG